MTPLMQTVSPPWPQSAVGDVPEESPGHALAFHGSGGTLFGIHVVNVLLTLLTLGIYYCWARVRTRRYVVGQTALDGDHFSYHGLGREVFLGYLKAGILFGIPLALLQHLPQLLDAGSSVTIAASVASYLLLLVLVPVARAGARRYRLSRMAWRGIRFAWRGRTGEYVKLFAVTSVLTTLTLGLYYPVSLARTHGYLVRHSCFGSQPFDFDGDGRDLVLSFLYAVLLTLPTLGLCWFWFVASKRRFLWSHTSFEGARFRCTVTGGRLLALKAGNLALIVLTLGLGWPLATVRNARFTCDTLTLDGALVLASVTQAPPSATATGEGLLNLLETDFDLG